MVRIHPWGRSVHDGEMDTATPQPPSPGPTGPASRPSEGTAPDWRLSRRRHGRMIAGVAAGLADWFDIDPTLVRVGFVALAFFGGLAVPVYLAAWLLIPEEGAELSVAEELLARERLR
jgi:phage shock protein PspC (stress-responsive transcriptional regulator)